MQRQEKDPLGQMLKASKRHPLSSPIQFHGCDSSGVCDRNRPLPPRRRRTSAAARPPRRGPALPPNAAASGLGRERRPRGSPDRSRRERTRVGKLASCVSCASLNLIVQHKHCTPSDKRMPGEIQGEEGAVADEENDCDYGLERIVSR